VANQTKYKMEITSSMDQEVAYFDHLSMKLVDEGLLVRAKSPTFGNFFSSLAEKTPLGNPSTFTAPEIWKNGRYFNIGRRFPPNLDVLCRADYFCLFVEGNPNLLWLTNVDMAKGFEQLIPEALSLNNFEDYFMGSCLAIQTLYQTQLRKGELEAKFLVMEQDQDE
jgi:hypothetical protein